MIHYLKFDSLQHAITVLLSNEPELLWNDNGIHRVKGSHDFALSLVGDVYHATGILLTDVEGNEYPEVVLVPGYHVNINCVNRALPEYLKYAEVHPVTPSVSFGGV